MALAALTTGRISSGIMASNSEFQLQSIMSRKLALLDSAEQLGANYANSIFQTGERNPEAYIQGLAAIHATEKELDVNKVMTGLMLSISNVMEENAKKMIKENIKSFMIG